MENQNNRKLLGACLIMLAIAIAYSGLLVIGVLLASLGVFVLAFTEFKLFGNEEEESEEEES